MKTTVSILVKNENIITKMTSSLWWFVKIFQSSKMLISVNGSEPVMLKASKQFYEIEVEPGTVVIEFTDPAAKSKNRMRKMTGGILGASFGLAGGGSVIDGALAGSEAAKMSIKENILQATLNEGDDLRISCKSKSNGKVKIKRLN